MLKVIIYVAVILMTSLQSFSQVNLSSGLLAYFPFNGNTLDASGNNNNAINFGATLTSDQWGNPNSAYSFNGISDYMQILNNAGLQPTTMTLCARVKPMGFYNGLCYNNCIIDKGNTDYIPGNYGIRFTNSLSGVCTIPGFANQNYRSDIGNMSTSSFTIPFSGLPYVATNQWDCIVSTYDGANVNVYVNGVFRYTYSQGTIGTNPDDIFLGRKNSAAYPYWFNGVMDEVRIYDRALNLQEIDSVCNLVTIPEIILNQYAAVTSYNPCLNALIVDTAAFFSPGDTVLLIQMKGSEIDTTNSASFGDLIDYHNCGNYEINVVQSVSGTSVSLLNSLTRQYDFINGKVQLVTVPTFVNYQLNTLHTCLPWNGLKGGVFIMNVLGTLTMNNNINVSGKGFRGGVSSIINSTVYSCNNFQFFDSPNIDQSAAKGEGISDVSISKSFARGKLANGGGGGNGHNGGGGGGSNANIGGLGGYQHDGCFANPIPNTVGGVGGLQLSYNNVLNKIFLGGGGGAGQSNNYYASFPASNLYSSNGAPGGGLVIVMANTINSISGNIITNGDNGYVCTNTGATAICHDGMGGGGAGGTVLISANIISGSLNVTCNGGNGGNMSASSGQGLLGPGGGGSGGLCWLNGFSIPSSVNVNTSFGMNGVCLNYSNNPWGAESGHDGMTLTGLQIPTDTALYVSSVTANAGSDTSICAGTSVSLQASGGGSYSWTPASSLSNPFIANPIATPFSTTNYTVTILDSNGCQATDIVTITVNNSPIVTAIASPSSLCVGSPTTLTATGANTYTWSGGILNGVPFNPGSTNTYTVIGTDANGCSGTTAVTVTVSNPIVVTVGPSTTLCSGSPYQLTANGATVYIWSPASSVSNANIANPIASPIVTTTYTVTGSNAGGCTNTATVTITVNDSPIVSATSSPSSLCVGSPTTLTATGANTYTWSGGIANGMPFNPSSTTTYTVIGTDANGCSGTSAVTVTVANNPVVSIVPNDPLLCLGDSIQLVASGANSYQWIPNSSINSINISNPIVYPSSTTTYTVTGTDASGCTGISSVTINVMTDPHLTVSKSGDVECNMHSVVLSVSGANSYTWWPSSYLSAPNSAVTNAMVNIPTTFIVTGTVGSCVVTDSIHVDVYNNDESMIYIPNAFTPNGDGNNDCLRILNSANFIDYYFAIYNRWGQRVFESDDPNTCWDGLFKNKEANTDVYYYYLDAKSNCGKIFKKGDITLLR